MTYIRRMTNLAPPSPARAALVAALDVADALGAEYDRLKNLPNTSTEREALWPARDAAAKDVATATSRFRRNSRWLAAAFAELDGLDNLPEFGEQGQNRDRRYAAERKHQHNLAIMLGMPVPSSANFAPLEWTYIGPQLAP